MLEIVSKTNNKIITAQIQDMMRQLAIPNEFFRIVERPTQSFYLFCGKPPKIKKLEDIIGHRLEIDGRVAIITYPLSYLVTKGANYSKKILYTLELMKNGLLEQLVWKYEDGKLRQVRERL